MNSNKNSHAYTDRLQILFKILLLLAGISLAFGVTTLDLISNNMSYLFHILTLS